MHCKNDSRQSLHSISLGRFAVLSRSRSFEAKEATRHHQIAVVDERGYRALDCGDDSQNRTRQARTSTSDRNHLCGQCGNAIARHRPETQARSARRTRIRNRLRRQRMSHPGISHILRSRNAANESSRDPRSSRSRRFSFESLSAIKPAKQNKWTRERSSSSRSNFSRESSAGILRIWAGVGAPVAWLALLLLRFTRSLVNRQWRKNALLG